MPAVKCTIRKPFQTCPECRGILRLKTTGYFWFDDKSWLHPTCWNTRYRQRLAESEIGILIDLSNYTFPWEDAGT